MSLIFLVGPRACGKTTIGKTLAGLRRVPFIDTDALLQEQAQRSVAEIVARDGWPEFRRLESEALREAARRCGYPDAPQGVVATGGGMVLAEDNRRFLRAAGEVIFLQAPADTLAERLTRNALPSQRPSLTGGDMVQEVAAVLAERLPLYKAAAHHWVDATQPVQRLCALLQRLSPPQNGRSDS
ncbi:MAG: shikimate kinase AroL [Desulfovibrio sp.]|uniref:shikimate kinase AroL n=1 Tax=Desulfovibrio sp. TaxID=885 RepID=UPI0025C6411A|nr:shikimate kinase AroL [Desulfovibrio sp.]MCI7568225.1 shikimate kinase AroL [Desulfovibrio sp.]